MVCATSKGSDQPAHTRSLIRAFASRLKIHHLDFLSLNGGCTGSSESTLTKIVFVAVFLGCTSTGRVGLCFLWFYVQELPKAQPAMVLVVKRLRPEQRLKVSSDRLAEIPHCWKSRVTAQFQYAILSGG